MNHPKREEWVPYLYGEAKPEARRELQAHLEACADCRSQLQSWKQSLHRLDHWKLPRLRKPAEWVAPALKWATAAALVLVIGFGIGRITAAGADAEKVRAQLEPKLREALRQELAQMIRDEASRSASATLTAANDHTEKLLAAYNTIQETRRTEDLEKLYVAIKKQLDTVAINTEREFIQLAGNSRATDPSRSSQQ